MNTTYASVCSIDTDNPDDGSGLAENEIECLDCGVPIIKDPEGLVRRCDTDEAHYHEDCGEDCPVICEVCLDHHFPPYCGGSSRSTLQARTTYGGRKGRSARRRLDILYRKLGWG